MTENTRVMPSSTRRTDAETHPTPRSFAFATRFDVSAMRRNLAHQDVKYHRQKRSRPPSMNVFGSAALFRLQLLNVVEQHALVALRIDLFVDPAYHTLGVDDEARAVPVLRALPLGLAHTHRL